MKNAAWPEPGTAGPYIPGDVACLATTSGTLPNKFKMDQLESDLDVFGDQRVVIKRWPGHTAGGQMAAVRLPKTGTVVLTSDNVYFAENVTKNLLPVWRYDNRWPARARSPPIAPALTARRCYVVPPPAILVVRDDDRHRGPERTISDALHQARDVVVARQHIRISRMLVAIVSRYRSGVDFASLPH
jgi:glyoxylase-like metal-dependent hydrolase (beta-lactamase superfamily II)